MTKILVEFGIDSDIIECPDWIVNDLLIYKREFIEWLYDKNNNHAYWMYSHGEKNGCKFRAQAYVEWLNKFVLGDAKEKASVIEECIDCTGYVCKLIYPKEIEHTLIDKKWDVIEWLQNKNEKDISLECEYLIKHGTKKYFKYAVVDWLNQFILNEHDDKAYVIEKQIDINKIANIPRITF